MKGQLTTANIAISITITGIATTVTASINTNITTVISLQHFRLFSATI
jgi:hypothetical protein